jgi:hypothetical protein
MTLERLTARAEVIAANAAVQARDRLLATAELPAGVTAESMSEGVVLSGKHLRRRMIADPNIRNFGR